MNDDQTPRLAVLIPAYRPTASLPDLVRALAAKAIPAIVIVDDGSGPEYRELFSRATAFPNVHLVRHATNLGKGAALKTGINYALCAFPELVGIVTADADGQHHPDDIEHIAGTLLSHPDCLVLGSRGFDGDVPVRSRFGNTLTSMVVRALIGQKLTDTQTGLRGIPTSLLLRILKIESTGYEYELEMLIAAHHSSVPVIEEPIRTIYEAGNQYSHFNPIVDSMKIYFVLARFGSVSLMTALLDNLVFYLAFRHTGHVLGSQILGRVFAVGFNYSMVRRSVFYSRQRHKTVLPKYLLAVLVSGAVSYAGIRLLSAKLGINPVSAKLMVETVLFFANFAIQRAFIFTPQAGAGGQGAATQKPAVSKPPRPAARRPRGAPVRLLSWLIFLVFLGVLGLEVYGFRTGHLFSQHIWEPVGLQRLARFGGEYLAIAAPLLLIVPWTFAGLILGLTILGTAIAVGPQAVLATAFFLIASCALGSKLLGRAEEDSVETHLCATLLGMGVWIFLMTFLARLPVNYPAFWAVLLALLVAWDLRGVWRRLAYWGKKIRSAELRPPGERAAFALLVFVLLMHWLVVLKPEASADGLAMHLAIPANIAANHAMTFEPSRFLWSVMPMGADWSYSIVYLFGGEYGARLLNFAMLLLVEALLYCAVRRWVSPSIGFLILALFAATPMVQLVTGELFVENLVAAMVLGMMTALWRFGENGAKRFLYLAAVLAGTAIATKVGGLAFLAVVIPFAVVEVRRHWKSLGAKPAAVCAAAVLLVLLTALPTYAVAYGKTGNPVFPFMNQKFPSPLLDRAADISFDQYRKPLSWRVPFDLTFHTNQSWEGQDGSFGFQYLLLAPLAVVALLVARRRPAVSGAVVALGAAIVIMRSEPNARYVYAALPLLSVPFAALLGWLDGHQRWLARVLVCYVIACTALDAYFIPSSSYYHKDFSMQSPLSRAGRERYMAYTAPVRLVIAYCNRAHPRAAVLIVSGSDIAGLTGEVYENHWHQFTTLDQIRKTLDMETMLKLVEGWRVRYFIARKPTAGEYARPPALRELLETCTTPEYEAGDFYLARLEPDCGERVEGAAARAASRPEIVVPPGYYDDFDPAIRYRGDWTNSDKFDGPFQHTISFSDVPAAEATFAFEGDALVYMYTKAPNRGLAAITIDGAAKGTIDLYSPAVEWQSSSRFCCLGPGKHLVVIRVLGQNNSRSTGQFVDLDGFRVE
jgi:glycosyltransferase involved in cell wall biosynthesis/4-amino-4-deoxy-L-arabinose transferase-like glycosyltransferase